MTESEEIAREFHETYERLAPTFGWDTQGVSRVSWEELPPENSALIDAVVQDLLRRGVIRGRSTI